MTFQMQGKEKKAAILLIYTGGTIGMKKDPRDGTLKPFDFSQIMEEVPELSKFAVKVDSYTFEPLIDSSDVEPAMWQSLASLIHKRYDDYDGFVVLHGTDTMAYSASALSFMLEGLKKPVIFTGSQLPVGEARTDGKENLISSVEIASAVDSNGESTVQEVCIFFNSKLLRGNRSTKVNSEGFDAFASPNYPALADAGIDIHYNRAFIHHSSQSSLSYHPELDTRVSIMKIHPGITEHIARHMLCDDGIRAAIIETYGSGNAISKPWFTDIVKEACAKGKIILNVTQCLSGSVNMKVYATGKALENAGVISGFDCTTESALAKLFHLMGKYPDNKDVRERLTCNIRGEISI